jgi:uncharacterized protein YndB with AHSA1/START domain
MPDLLHQILIRAAPERVYEAVTAQEALCKWWTGDVVAEPTVGSIAEFGFSNRATLFRMRIDELMPAKRVVWTCLGDWPEWKDTRLTWEITPGDKATTLRFTHADWRSTDGAFADCNTSWGTLMHRLRDWAEGKAREPVFKGYV